MLSYKGITVCIHSTVLAIGRIAYRYKHDVYAKARAYSKIFSGLDKKNKETGSLPGRV